MLENTEPKALLAEAELAPTARQAGSSLELDVIPFGDDDGLAALLDGAPEVPCAPDRPLLIINTSGTTGPPRGAVITGQALHSTR